MAFQVTLYEFAKDNFNDTSFDLEDSLAEVSSKSEHVSLKLSFANSYNVTWDAITRTKYLVGWRYLRLG